MAGKKLYVNYFKNLLRACAFYIAIIFPLLFLAKYMISFSPFSLNDFATNPWAYLSASVLSFFFVWFTVLFLNLILPTLLLIFLKLERERSPKKIIQFGDRFRRVGLSSPQIFILKETSRFNNFIWGNKLIGYFGLPSPLGAILLLDSRASQLSEESLDEYLCPMVVEARYARFSSILFSFPSFFVSLGFISVGLSIYFLQERISSILAFSAVGFATSVIFALLYTKSRGAFLEERLHTVFAIKQKHQSVFNFLPNFKKDLYHPWYLTAIPLACFAILFLSLVSSLPIHSFDSFVSMASNRLEPKPEPIQESVQTSDSSETISTASSPAAPVANFQTPVISDLSTAINSGDMRKTIQLIGRGKNIKDRDPAVSGATPLLLALKNGDTEMAYLLLVMGSSLSNEVDDAGRGALFYALESPNRLRTVGYVLSGRVDVNQKSLDGLTAYDYAIKNGWTDVTEILAKRGIASTPDATSAEKK